MVKVLNLHQLQNLNQSRIHKSRLHRHRPRNKSSLNLSQKHRLRRIPAQVKGLHQAKTVPALATGVEITKETIKEITAAPGTKIPAIKGALETKTTREAMAPAMVGPPRETLTVRTRAMVTRTRPPQQATGRNLDRKLLRVRNEMQ